ncbi:MAG: DinB family protein [Nanoarchaeota archaeon]
MSQVKDLLGDYKSIRARTIEFLEKVPKEKWTWRPHALLGSFGMQVRHMSTSQQSYIEGIKKGKIDFSQKEFDKEIETNKEKAIKRLKELDKELSKLISSMKDFDKKIIFVDGVSGTSEEDLATLLNYLIQHEFYHQGIFTCYGRLVGMGKFLFM